MSRLSAGVIFNAQRCARVLNIIISKSVAATHNHNVNFTWLFIISDNRLLLSPAYSHVDNNTSIIFLTCENAPLSLML